jgi:hypothetical protein
MGTNKINVETLKEILSSGYTILEAAELLEVSKQGIYNFMKQNNLNPAINLISDKSVKTRKTILHLKYPNLNI